VNRPSLNADIAVMACETSYKLIMVSRNINHPSPLASATQKLLQHIIVNLWPVNTTLQSPNIDDISDQIQRLKMRATQEIQKRFCLATARS